MQRASACGPGPTFEPRTPTAGFGDKGSVRLRRATFCNRPEPVTQAAHDNAAMLPLRKRLVLSRAEMLAVERGTVTSATRGIAVLSSTRRRKGQSIATLYVGIDLAKSAISTTPLVLLFLNSVLNPFRIARYACVHAILVWIRTTVTPTHNADQPSRGAATGRQRPTAVTLA